MSDEPPRDVPLVREGDVESTRAARTRSQQSSKAVINPHTSTDGRTVNVFNEYCTEFLAIPREIVIDTVGLQRYLTQEAEQATKKYKFQLCRKFLGGSCHADSRCEFIHSRHTNNPQFDELIVKTDVHHNTPCPKGNLYTRHPSGVCVRIIDVVDEQACYELDSGNLYVTRGSTFGIEATISRRNIDIRLKNCLHYERGLCARGPKCNFIHMINFGSEEDEQQYQLEQQRLQERASTATLFDSTPAQCDTPTADGTGVSSSQPRQQPQNYSRVQETHTYQQNGGNHDSHAGGRGEPAKETVVNDTRNSPAQAHPPPQQQSVGLTAAHLPPTYAQPQPSYHHQQSPMNQQQQQQQLLQQPLHGSGLLGVPHQHQHHQLYHQTHSPAPLSHLPHQGFNQPHGMTGGAARPIESTG